MISTCNTICECFEYRCVKWSHPTSLVHPQAIGEITMYFNIYHFQNFEHFCQRYNDYTGCASSYNSLKPSASLPFYRTHLCLLFTHKLNLHVRLTDLLNDVHRCNRVTNNNHYYYCRYIKTIPITYYYKTIPKQTMSSSPCGWRVKK